MRFHISFVPTLFLLHSFVILSWGLVVPQDHLALAYPNASLSNLHDNNELYDISPLASPIIHTKQCGPEVPRLLKDWWHYAVQLGHNATNYAGHLLEGIVNSTATDVAEEIADFKVTVAQIVKTTSKFREEFSSRHISMRDVSSILTEELLLVFEELKTEFGDVPTLPTDRRAKEREEIIDKVLDKVEIVFIKVVTKVGMEAGTLDFKEINLHIKRVLLITGMLIDKHPIILETILIAGTLLIVPEAWFLRPILSLFGWGPNGPVKGSIATWAQRRFWGAAVEKGSWFSHLQRAGMKLPKPWLLSGFMAVTVALGVGGGVCSCLEWFHL